MQSTAANHERLLRGELSAFKEEMQRNLTQHQHAIDRQLTDFLNKQNAMVQNLSQQIDSFSRVSRAQTMDLGATNAKLSALMSAFDTQKENMGRELSSLTEGINELRTLLAEVQGKLRSQDGSISSMSQASQDTAMRLEQALEKLKQLPLIGGKFK
jgi:ABC-type transporter Mla subunit MlaD